MSDQLAARNSIIAQQKGAKIHIRRLCGALDLHFSKAPFKGD
jgi:hypothetical protein